MPDVSGIDKVFDYLVPHALEQEARIGNRVRIDLNGRRVAGWIVDVGPFDPTVHSLEPSRLAPLVAVSGKGVEPEVVPLTKWVASRWWGPWRSVLTSASAPRLRAIGAHAARGRDPRLPDDAVSDAATELRDAGGGLLVVPPNESALHAVATWAGRGAVLVICPTVHMAVAGAAALRRRGFATALVPDDWDKARAGVDIVIGARSAVFAPCAELSGVVVIDEHDELLHDERVPTWDATSVAIERARLAAVPVMLTSAVPSLRSLMRFEGGTKSVASTQPWPSLTVVDLNEVPVGGSLLSSELLESIRDGERTTVCVLNVKGKARLIVCKSCRAMQSCPECNALLSRDDDEVLRCPRCGHDSGSVCTTCGRTSFVVPRVGVSQLRSEVEASTGVRVHEVTSESPDEWTEGRVFIGTEAVLHRVRSADRIFFADIDRDLGAPRMSASQEVLALVARAARTVGAGGSVVIQTRQPSHRLMRALASSDVSSSLRAFASEELASRRQLGLPPFAHVARVTLSDGRDISSAGDLPGVQIAREASGWLLRADEWGSLDAAVTLLRSSFGTAIRVGADPLRY